MRSSEGITGSGSGSGLDSGWEAVVQKHKLDWIANCHGDIHLPVKQEPSMSMWHNYGEN